MFTQMLRSIFSPSLFIGVAPTKRVPPQLERSTRPELLSQEELSLRHELLRYQSELFLEVDNLRMSGYRHFENM